MCSKKVFENGKVKEEEHFYSVYGKYDGWEVQKSESPDFLCYRQSKIALGVEITELYTNETDARLKNISGYTTDLLDGKNFRHKDDPKNIKVDQVKLIKNGTEEEHELMAIIQEEISFQDKVILFQENIEKKEKLLKSYSKKSPKTDLIIHDSSSLFWEHDFEKFFHLFRLAANEKIFNNSGFREIWFISNLKKKDFKIPIKLNLFCSDIFNFENQIREIMKEDSGLDPINAFKILFYCLRLAGYSNYQVSQTDEGTGIVAGGHLYLYSQDGKCIRDHTTTPDLIPLGEKISDLTEDISEENKHIASEIYEKSKESIAILNLCFEIETKDKN